MSDLTVFTGGSGGSAKSLQRPQESWRISARLEGAVFGLSADDRFLVIADPRHSLWSYVFFRAKELQAPCMGWSAADLRRMPESCQATVLYAVPSLLALAIEKLESSHAGPSLFSTVRRVLLGGASNHLSLARLRRHMPCAQIYEFYGSAECSFIAHATLEEHGPGPFETFPFVETRVDAGSQLWVRSPMTIAFDRWHATGDRIEIDVSSGRDALVSDPRPLGPIKEGEAKENQAKERQAKGGLMGIAGEEVRDTAVPIRFRLLGRVDRQLHLHGKKHSPEPLERLLRELWSHHALAILALDLPRFGPRAVLVYCDSEDWPSSRLIQARSLALAQQPGFPTIRALLRLSDWPLLDNGKLAHGQLQQMALEAARRTDVGNG